MLEFLTVVHLTPAESVEHLSCRVAAGTLHNRHLRREIPGDVSRDMCCEQCRKVEACVAGTKGTWSFFTAIYIVENSTGGIALGAVFLQNA